MRVNVILRYVGMIMLLLAFFMFVSAGISYVNHMDSAFYPLLLSALLTALLGGFPLIFVEKQDRITNKEGFCIVVGSWLLACVVGMFPYLIWGGEFSVINAWFETVSGFTTTGSSILQNVEALPRGLQFWRMSSTWALMKYFCMIQKNTMMGILMSTLIAIMGPYWNFVSSE